MEIYRPEESKESYEKAHSAACELGNRYGEYTWWKGVSVEGNRKEGYFLRVYVNEDFCKPDLPLWKWPYWLEIKHVETEAYANEPYIFC